jgi:hypothetical protein
MPSHPVRGIMNLVDASNRNDTRLGAVVLLIAVACAVFGGHLLLIAALGSAMPFWDQWDAEAMNLYVPYLSGALTPAEMFAAHNEHRIVVTRLLALFHLELAGEWNPRLEMILGAMVHSGMITWLVALLMPLVGAHRRLLLALFVAFLFALPIGFQNTLWGFQSQFYFVALFAIGAMICFANATAFSLRWFSGMALAVLSYFSLSSGAATVLVAAILVILQLAVGARSRRVAEFVALAIMVAAGLAMVLGIRLSPSQPSFDALVFIQAVIAFAALPLVTLAGVALVQGPTVWFTWHALATRAARDNRVWFAVGLAGWVASQIVLFSYGRGGVMGARYFDIVILAYPVGLVAVLALADRLRATRARRLATPVAVAWVLMMVTVLAILGYYSSLRAALEWSTASGQQMTNVGAYLADNDMVHLTDKGLGIPYPDPQRLADILANPDVRAILPPEIRPGDADVMGVREKMMLKGALAEGTAAFVRTLLLIAPVFLALGLGLFFAAGTAASLRRPE